MVVQAAIPIATAVGEFAAPYLIKEATKLGIKKFIQNYGSTAFQAISAGVVGGMIEQVTAPLDLQQEKLFGMPVSRITGQEQVYSDIEEPTKVKPLEYIPTVQGGEELPPIEQIPFPAKTEVEPVQEGFKVPEKIETIKGLEIPPQEIKIPPGFQKPEPLGTDILTKDIVKQTKDLVPVEPEFGALTETEKQTALAIKGDKPDFYSRAIEAIKTAKDDKYTKGKWASILKNSTTKYELDYLGLTELLVGKESITKQELLKLVEGKDIAPAILVRPVPKEYENPMYITYSLGGGQIGTDEQIVFQLDEKIEEPLFKSEHFQGAFGSNTFAHARVQVGYNAADASGDKEELESEENQKLIKTFFNTLIIDEIQSDWIQKLQKEGSAKDWKIIKGSDITKEFINKNYEGVHELINITGDISDEGMQTGNVMYQWDPIQNKMVPYRKIEPAKYYTFSKDKMRSYSSRSIEEAEKNKATWEEAVADFPIKDSKKFVELVLNEMIRKAVTDGRDSIAITNGQIQYNRYAGGKREGLKKFYDTIVYDQLNKIAEDYGVKLEVINIDTSERDFLGKIGWKVRKAREKKLQLEKITIQELWDIIKGETIPGHASLYSNTIRGQGADYIKGYLRAAVTSQRDVDQIRERTGDTTSFSVLKNEVYVWKGVPPGLESDERYISWDLPIVPVKDVQDYALSKERDILSIPDYHLYTDYLATYYEHAGKDKYQESISRDSEQLIKMELPKKLQKDILKKPIRLTKKIDEQTQRLVA